MYELKEDKFYQEYNKYLDSVIDYCIITVNSPYNKELHQKVVLFAFDIFNQRYEMDYKFNKELMQSKEITKEELFNDNYYKLFLNPPFGTPFRRISKRYEGTDYEEEIIENKPYTIKDFNYLNDLLFPISKDNLIIYEWNTSWSNYFEDGLEWWGARCISIYDKSCDRFIVIAASITD